MTGPYRTAWVDPAELKRLRAEYAGLQVENMKLADAARMAMVLWGVSALYLLIVAAVLCAGRL